MLAGGDSGRKPRNASVKSCALHALQVLIDTRMDLLYFWACNGPHAHKPGASTPSSRPKAAPA